VRSSKSINDQQETNTDNEPLQMYPKSTLCQYQSQHSL